MTKTRVSADKSRQRVQKILQGAATLFKDRGYADVTLDDIAQALGISKLTIYYHIEGKGEIFYQIHYLVIKAVLKGLKQILESDDLSQVKLRRAIINHVNVVCSEMSPSPDVRYQLHKLSSAKRQRIINMRDQCDRMLRRIIRQGIDDGTFVDCDIDIISFIIEGAINYMPFWYSKEGRLSKRQLAEIFADYLVTGLLSADRSDKTPNIVRPGQHQMAAGVGRTNHVSRRPNHS